MERNWTEKDISSLAARKKVLEALWTERYGKLPASPRYFSSPGRAEIVGNHTDHNLGKVLVAAISCDVFCLVEKREDDVVEIVSEGFHPIRIRLSDTERRERERGKSISFARGVMHYLQERGYAVGGFNAVTTSNVFRGAGVSSSAAFSVLVAEIENRLYLNGALSPMDKARAAQYAENVFFGKPCGLLDQSGVALGGLNKIDFADPENPVIGRAPTPAGYRLVLTSTGGSHAGLTSHYAAIKSEMSKVAGYFGQSVLRGIREEQIVENLRALREYAGDRAVLRALHYVAENERVDRAVAGLERGDVNAFLAAVQESGESSLGYLQNCSVPGGKEQPIVLGLRLSERYLKEGAFRMMGGGFAGTVLAIVHENCVEAYAAGMAAAFGKENVFFADVREAGACELHI